MGAGELNVGRALQQLAPGKFAADSGDVPQIGWDFGHTAGLNAVNHYPIAGTLEAQHFISITLAWDRAVIFKSDANQNGKYDVGDSFQESTVAFPNPDSDDLINDLAIYLLPKGAVTIQSAVADSISTEGVVQHIFFQLPTTGEYEIWVKQRDQENLLPLQNGQDYALAWWYGLAPPLTVAGDYNGDGMINAQDYAVWRNGFGSTVTPGTGADGNGNGVIDSGDYVAWRNAMTAGSGAGSASAVPEPAIAMYLLVGLAIALQKRRIRND